MEGDFGCVLSLECKFGGVRLELAVGLMEVQKTDGNQEVQGSPRFVQSLPPPAGLEEMATYLSRAARAGASRRASPSLHCDRGSGSCAM